MTISLKHIFQSNVADSGDVTLVQPSNWNDEHTLTLSTAKIIGRYSSGAGAAEEISIGNNISISTGSISAIPSGSNNWLQFNNSGSFGAASNYSIGTSLFGYSGVKVSDSNVQYSIVVSGSFETAYGNTSAVFDYGLLQPGLLQTSTSNVSNGYELRTLVQPNLITLGQPSNYVEIQAPSNVTSYTITLPTTDGDSGQVLATDGTGILSWVGKANSGSITSSGLTMSTGTLLGRSTANTGAVEEISVGTGLSLSGGTLSSTVTATPGGSSGQLQYNNAGAFAGTSGITTTGTELTIASGTKTTSTPILDMAQTWNAGAVTFTGLKLNVTDTASAAASLLMDLQVGGASRLSLSKNGILTFNSTTFTTALGFNIFDSNNRFDMYYPPNSAWRVAASSTFSDGPAFQLFGGTSPNFPGQAFFDYGSTARSLGSRALFFRSATNTSTVNVFHINGTGDIGVGSGQVFGWSSTTDASATKDTIITRRAAANLRLGAADAAAPVAQTLSVQSVVAGTTNTAGANLTITGSQGTGTGAGGSIIFQVAPAGSSGTAQNALATALTIAANREVFTGTSGFSSTGTTLGAGTITVQSSTVNVNGPYFRVSTIFTGTANEGRVQIGFGVPLAFSMDYPYGGDVLLYPDASNILALRNGTNAQTFRVYGSYTNASNYSRLAITGNSITSEVAGTGSLAVTADAPILNLAQTWNNAAVTFTGLKLNVTNTASASASLLLDLQVGGTSQFSVNRAGTVSTNALSASSTLSVVAAGTSAFEIGAAISKTRFEFWLGDGAIANPAILRRRGTANLQLGAADAAAPVAQTLSVQSVVAGTLDTAGQNFTITGSQGTGTGAGGSIIFQVAPAGSSGTAQNALATALTINSAKQVAFDSGGSASTPVITFGTSNTGFYGGATGWAFTTGGTNSLTFDSGYALWIRDNGGNFTIGASADVRLYRDAANTLAQRNGTNAQTFNVYNTYTDASNYERLSLQWYLNEAYIVTEKAGTGSSRFLNLRAAGQLGLGVGTGSVQWRINTSAHIIAVSDNSYDIGASGTGRPRNIYAATTVDAPTVRTSTAYTVATLPAAGTAGRRAYVTDATAPTFLGTLTGGGTVVCPVFDNGTAWVAA